MRKFFASLILAVMVIFAVAVLFESAAVHRDSQAHRASLSVQPSPESADRTLNASTATFDLIRADWKPNRIAAAKPDLRDNFRPHRIFQYSPPVCLFDFPACETHPSEVFKEIVYKNQNFAARE